LFCPPESSWRPQYSFTEIGGAGSIAKNVFLRRLARDASSLTPYLRPRLKNKFPQKDTIYQIKGTSALYLCSNSII
jgi:hypothetical protein